MMGERLFCILGLVDEELIQEAAPGPARRARTSGWRKALAAAACLTVVCGAGFAWLVTGGFQGFGSAAPGDSAGGSGHDGGTVFMSYAGPVFPLTTLEETPALTAERALTWDFAPGTYDDGTPNQHGVTVTDGYTLTNATSEDVTCTALYPFAGDLQNIADTLPTLTVDGEAVEAAFYAGPYVGGFRGTEADGGSWNLAEPGSWEAYQALLAGGGYQEAALADYPVLNIPVTVYRFSDYQAPLEEYDAATQAIAFTMDRDRTTVLSYGFNGMEWDEDTGFFRYSYFVPDGRGRSQEPKVLVVLGDDLGDYTLEGYKNGDCSPGNELSGVSCTVTRSETTLDAVLDEICQAYAQEYVDQRSTNNAFDYVSQALFQGAAAELLTQYGFLAGDGQVDRYAGERLDDLIGELLYVNRVLYLAFPVTVPAGSSVEVTATLWKEPSYDFDCSGSENVGLQGYDLVTELGSTLSFTGQTAALANADGVELVRQNFGFDLETGVTEVALDLADPHYYLEVRARNGD